MQPHRLEQSGQHGIGAGELHKVDAFTSGAATHRRRQVHGEALRRRAPNRQVGRAVADISEAIWMTGTQELSLGLSLEIQAVRAADHLVEHLAEQGGRR